MIEGVIIAVLGILVGIIVAVWQVSQRRAVERDRDRLEQTNQQHLVTLDERASEVSDLGSRISDLQAQLARADEREKALTEAQEQARNQFKALAGDTLKDSQDVFLKQANERLKPINDLLTRYQKQLAEIEEKRDRAYGKITEQVVGLSESQRDLRAETANLVRALRRPEGRGRWGELQMERLFELAGMSERFDYDAQASVDAAAGGKLRPDFTVHLPNDRVIVVDAKTPLDAYLSAVEATDEAERQTHYDRHARNVKEMATSLSRKEYWSACAGSPEFVVMFIPGEAMLYAAVQRDPELIERAMADNVVIATPTLMMALLKTVALGWTEQAISENAREISDAGKELYDRLRVMFSHLTNLHKALDKTNEHYNKLVGSVERNVLPQARKFEHLEAAGPKRVPDALPQVEVNPRRLEAPEAATSDD